MSAVFKGPSDYDPSKAPAPEDLLPAEEREKAIERKKKLDLGLDPDAPEEMSDEEPLDAEPSIVLTPAAGEAQGEVVPISR